MPDRLRLFNPPPTRGGPPLPASYALHEFLHPTGSKVVRAGLVESAVCAMFEVLTESQQDRALQSLGWHRARPEPKP